MAAGALKWDEVGKKLYETGVSNVALYKQDDNGNYPVGVAWSGVTGITKSPKGAEKTSLYADNVKYINLISAEELDATIEAYMSPEEFDECDGAKEIEPGMTVGQQDRRAFGLAYKTIIGNDVKSNAYGYKINILYGCLASPSEKAAKTINDSPEAETLSWEVSTTPISVTGAKPSSLIEIDSTKVETPANLAKLESVLFGKDAGEDASTDPATVPWLPTPDQIAKCLKDGTVPTPPAAG